MLNSGFFLLLSFYKSFFLFAIFSYKFICIWIWAGVRKGADSGFTIGNRESIYNWGWLEWCKGSPWTSLSVKDCFPPRMERKGQSVYVYLIAGWSWHWVGLAQGRWRHAARVVARINSVKDSTTPDDKRWGGNLLLVALPCNKCEKFFREGKWNRSETWIYRKKHIREWINEGKVIDFSYS